MTGGHSNTQDVSKIDVTLIKRGARKVGGADVTTRKEIRYPLPDARSLQNHYILEVANMFDRVLRAKCSAAQARAQRVAAVQFNWNMRDARRNFLENWPSIRKMVGLTPELDYDFAIKTNFGGRLESERKKDITWELTTSTSSQDEKVSIAFRMKPSRS